MTTTESVTGATEVRHLIGGDWVAASDGATFETRDPHDGSLLGTVPRGTADDGEAAITAARTAFDDGPWPRMSPKERAKILHAVADKVDEHREELALIETRDGGKSINQSLHAEIPRVAHNLRFFADYVSMAANEAYQDGDLLSYVLYPPAGVVSAISPWNAPLMLATWKIAPALAFGNTTVLKPAPQTPLTAHRFAQLALEAGLPEGVLNVVHGFGGEAVAGPLTADPRVDRITFTGSSATGVRILQAAAVNHTPVSAEMGGKSANIVFDDADLDVAVPMAIRAIFGGNGQVCLSGSRLLVQNSIMDEFLDRFTEEAKKLTVGDPKDPSNFLGPLIEQRHLEKVHGYVELAQEEGGKVVTGGSRLTDDARAKGFYYPPTVGLPMDDEHAMGTTGGPVRYEGGLPGLIARARALTEPGTRRILGIAGPPGSGKSTVAAAVLAALGPSAVVVPMDGFHLAGAELVRLGRAGRKGAPDTFDAAGYVALLRRLREPGGETVYAPKFHRDVEESYAGSIAVPPDVPLVITEGNYLLLDEQPWARVRDLLDEAWFLAPDDEERVTRLVERHIRFGKSPDDAREWVRRSDERNTALVAPGRARADVVVLGDPV